MFFPGGSKTLITLSDGNPLQTKSPILLPDRLIHLIENRAPVLSPTYIRADPLPLVRGNFRGPFCPSYLQPYRRTLALNIRQSHEVRLAFKTSIRRSCRLWPDLCGISFFRYSCLLNFPLLAGFSFASEDLSRLSKSLPQLWEYFGYQVFRPLF